MVLVDSSVWIDYLGPRASPVDPVLEGLIRPANQVVITGVVFQEVLQGIRNHRSFQLTRKLMGRLPFLFPDVQTHFNAAELFKEIASKGRSITTIDCFLAALAIQYRLSFFTLDADFGVIQKYSNLKLFTLH